MAADSGKGCLRAARRQRQRGSAAVAAAAGSCGGSLTMVQWRLDVAEAAARRWRKLCRSKGGGGGVGRSATGCQQPQLSSVQLLQLGGTCGSMEALEAEVEMVVQQDDGGGGSLLVAAAWQQHIGGGSFVALAAWQCVGGGSGNMVVVAEERQHGSAAVAVGTIWWQWRQCGCGSGGGGSVASSVAAPQREAWRQHSKSVSGSLPAAWRRWWWAVRWQRGSCVHCGGSRRHPRAATTRHCSGNEDTGNNSDGGGTEKSTIN